MRKYNFDEIVNREGTDCLKVDGMKMWYGDNGYTPMWVADMDFRIPDEVIADLKERADHGILGYGIKPQSYFQAVIDFYKRRHGLEMERKAMMFVPGVVAGIHWSILSLTEENDGITIMTPVYGPFKKAVQTTKRTLHESTLINNNGRYEVDFADFEEKLKVSKMFILCSPHNPAGRVWTREELEKMAELCVKHDVMVISDEIHCDLIMPGHKHIPFVNISDEIAQRTIMLVSPSKTFNLAGVLASNLYVRNEEMFKKIYDFSFKIAVYMANCLSIVAARAAYAHGDNWLDQVVEYIYGNYQYIKDRFEKEMPKVKVTPLEGTYLLWLDCREVSTDGKVLKEIFETKGKVLGEDGGQFGDAGEGYYRLNLACPRSTVCEVADKMISAYNEFLQA